MNIQQIWLLLRFFTRLCLDSRLLLSGSRSMTAAPRVFKKTGRVATTDDSFRADLQFRDASGLKKHILGPRRANSDAAQDDLRAIHEGGAPFHDDPPKAFEAMMEVAHRLQKEAAKMKDSLSEAGRVAECNGFFRADVQYLATTGQYAHLRGPKHTSAAEAERDLDHMRRAAALFPDDRVKSFQAMHAEARPALSWCTPTHCIPCPVSVRVAP